ncbi:hypothetical protein QFZ48_003629 [Chitinophaga sp. W2I13]|uniref:hypothetical protein n=1 Tax=Chitinophaga sp. W2I13 TaxID=3373923 RepID=UPI003D21D2C2
MRFADDDYDRIQLLLRAGVFSVLNVLTFIENQYINMCYEIITKWITSHPMQQV